MISIRRLLIYLRRGLTFIHLMTWKLITIPERRSKGYPTIRETNVEAYDSWTERSEIIVNLGLRFEVPFKPNRAALLPVLIHGYSFFFD